MHRILNRTPTTLFPILKRWSSNTDLKSVLADKIPQERERIKQFRKEYGHCVVDEVTVNQIYMGMRGVKALICETSVLDPDQGIHFRGCSVDEIKENLPHAEDGEQPLPEGLFWLLVTGELPTSEQVQQLSKEWAERSCLPDHVCKFLNDIPKEVHPMSKLSAACCILNTESEFVKAYNSGAKKTHYWESTYEDAMNLIAKVSPICAMIYRNTFKDGGDVGGIDPDKDWSWNFCGMLGESNPEFVEFMRLFFTLHSDHEGGNVSAHATHLVATALSDAYISYASGMSGLAGPLHGLANQEVLAWVLKMREEIGDEPSEEQVKEFVLKTLKSGQVVPGFGHAVLRNTDPRFTHQREFALKHMPDDHGVKIIGTMFKVVPPILTELGKVKNPWPNVDLHSGVVLQYYGIKAISYYTVLFGMSRALGVMASLIWDRALGSPLERPKSLSTDDLMKLVKKD